MKHRLTPQQKKKHSYERDGRNSYGEHSTARKRIKRNKNLVRRSNRRAEKFSLTTSTVDEELVERQEARIAGKKLKYWHKWPDMKLGDYVKSRLERRERLGMAKKKVR